MDASFWHERWEAGRIAFHQADGNDLLRHHLGALELPDGARVFVPLSGKTRDIAWLLSQGFEVAAIELNPLAIEQLFAELGVTPEIRQVGALRHHAAPGLDVFVGDFFELDAATLGKVDATYDRAALVALPHDMRGGYASHLADITDNASQLLITFEYADGVLQGPPFSVDGAEVTRVHEAKFDRVELQKRLVPGGLRGVEDVSERVWHLVPKTI